MENLAVLQVDTPLCTLDVYEDYCVITHKKSAFNMVGQKYFSGEKRFFYRDLTAIQFREPGKITDGYLEFEYPGARSGASGQAYQSENAMTFAKVHLEQMREARDYINHRIMLCKTSNTASPKASSATTSADELLKFKELLEAGVITQEEFDNKKNQIMGIDSFTTDLRKKMESREEEERKKQEEKAAREEAERIKREQEKIEREIAREREREAQKAIREEEAKREKEVQAANKPLKFIMLGVCVLLAVVGMIISPAGAGMAIVFFPFLPLIMSFLYLSKLNGKIFKTLTLVFGCLGFAITFLASLGSIGDPEMSMNVAPLMCVALGNALTIVMTFIKKQR